jgi:hypothetical protein
MIPELRGINRASTFTGFCSVHDDSIFAPIEKTQFISTPQQCFLLGYRALGREVYMKTAALSKAGFMRQLDRGASVPEQIALQGFMTDSIDGMSAGLADLSRHKRKYDDALASGRFHTVRAYIVETELAPPIMCSGGFAPEYDFAGRPLQDLSNLSVPLQFMTVSSFFGGRTGAIVFCWLADSDAAAVPFVHSLQAVSDENLTGALTRLLFEHFENLHLSPTWWEGLAVEVRQKLTDRLSLSGTSFVERNSNCLMDDGMAFLHWTILSRTLIQQRTGV